MELGFRGQWGVLMGVLLGYLAVLVLLGAILPGRRIAGAILADKTRLYYKCNGGNSLLFTYRFFTWRETEDIPLHGSTV